MPPHPTHLNEALVLSEQKDQVVLKVPPGTQNQLVLLVHQKKEFPWFPAKKMSERQTKAGNQKKFKNF